MNQEEQALFLTLYYLDDDSLLQACQVNKRFYQKVCQTIWLGRIKDKYGLDRVDVDRNKGNKSYSQYYFELLGMVIATVTKVEWKPTRSGSYIAIVHFKPVKTGKYTIARAAESGQNVIDLRIGPGAVVSLLINVIPRISRVLKPAEVLQLPGSQK